MANTRILVVYYSLYGHMFDMAKAVAEGAASAGDVEVVLRRVAEFPAVEAAIEKNDFMKSVRESQKDIPVATHDDLASSDGFVFGSPTRFGNMTAQMKQYFDSAGALWAKGVLEGRPAGVFTASNSTHGGQETTLVSMMIPLLHWGMLIVGVPYSVPGMLHHEARGASPYGASTIAGSQGELHPAAEDLAIARALGRRVAETAKKLKA